MWKWILKAAVYLGKSEWAKAAARVAIDKLRKRSENTVRALSATVGITVPPPDAIRHSQLIRSRHDTLKPGQVVTVDGTGYRINRLISSSQAETIYEADLA